jgi:K+-sensing histidine kinase KdpD
MMQNDSSKRDSVTYDELLQQNQALLQEIEDLRAQETFAWNLFVETSRKLQVYSASIKAAVSSLLNYDIFWDSKNQHEFLETIDSSVNQVSEMIVLLTLAFRTQANNLVLSRDSHLLQEILSVSHTIAKKKNPDIKLEVSFPSDGMPVMVDYDYLTKALVLLYEVLIAQPQAGSIRVEALETSGAWFLDFTGFGSPIARIIGAMHRCKAQPASNEFLSPENTLKLNVICEILKLQQISVEILDGPGQLPILRLRVPEVAPI